MDSEKKDYDRSESFIFNRATFVANLDVNSNFTTSLRLSGHSSYFWYPRSAVRIQSSAKFYTEHVFNGNC